MDNTPVNRRNWELTAVEGMVVVVIIGMLLAIAVPQFRQLRDRKLVERARSACERIWEAELEYLAGYGAFKEARGTEAIEAPAPDGLGIRLDRSLPFYFAAVDSMVVAFGVEAMLGTRIIYAPGRKAPWRIDRK